VGEQALPGSGTRLGDVAVLSSPHVHDLGVGDVAGDLPDDVVALSPQRGLECDVGAVGGNEEQRAVMVPQRSRDILEEHSLVRLERSADAHPRIAVTQSLSHDRGIDSGDLYAFNESLLGVACVLANPRSQYRGGWQGDDQGLLEMANGLLHISERDVTQFRGLLLEGSVVASVDPVVRGSLQVHERLVTRLRGERADQVLQNLTLRRLDLILVDLGEALYDRFERLDEFLPSGRIGFGQHAEVRCLRIERLIADEGVVADSVLLTQAVGEPLFRDSAEHRRRRVARYERRGRERLIGDPCSEQQARAHRGGRIGPHGGDTVDLGPVESAHDLPSS